MKNVKFEISFEEVSRMINTLGNCSGALQVLMLTNDRLNDNQRNYLEELELRVQEAINCIMDLPRREQIKP